MRGRVEQEPVMRTSLAAAAVLLALGGAGAVQGQPAEAPSPKPEGPYLSAWQVKSMQERDFEARLHYLRLVRGNPERRQIALTFDDGPHLRSTNRLLDILKEYHVPATFFVVGTMVDKHPELVQREAAEGHEVALRLAARGRRGLGAARGGGGTRPPFMVPGRPAARDSTRRALPRYSRTQSGLHSHAGPAEGLASPRPPQR